MSQALTRYEEQKTSGARSASGALRLQKLSGKHLRIIQLHLTGMTGAAIAEEMGCTGSWVSTVLNDPLAKDVISRRFVDCDNEMLVKSTQVVRAAMEDETDRALQLRAADMVWKARGRYDKRPDERVTAEDIVQRMLRVAKEIGSVSLTVTAGPAGGAGACEQEPCIEGEVLP